ncbi:biopolymer transport protein ExbD/TolR [bacterium BMS3Abin05]|nr:biopolymer transport protein ExbD/TolR [bacterium BMS3Abin05]GBE27559.1 biopolymer transport protein ExbD/TolR [bacterium BMS3Bbin03]HDL78873.1 hypothetical protein [Bacteroidota bacterium]
MAFRTVEDGHKKVQLISLIDMIFILLVFFMVTVTVVRLTIKEQKLPVPTPVSEPGRAQIVIQLLDNGNFLWIDDRATSLISKKMESVEKKFSYLSPSELNKKKTREALKVLINRNIYRGEQLDNQLSKLVKKSDSDPSSQYFVMLRSPDKIPYYKIIHIIQKLSDAKYQNILYGCVGGSIEDIKKSKNVKVIIERDKNGRRRENLQINF